MYPKINGKKFQSERVFSFYPVYYLFVLGLKVKIMTKKKMSLLTVRQLSLKVCAPVQVNILLIFTFIALSFMLEGISKDVFYRSILLSMHPFLWENCECIFYVSQWASVSDNNSWLDVEGCTLSS